LIDLQIENTKLNERVQNETFDVKLRLDHANSDLLETQIKEERAAAAIKELQD
jgi:hypothetical protein